jgi:outer membrane receptor protein involved in Fe transport
MRVFRDVGQLDFNDFVSTAAFADDIVEGGNPDLRPQTAWAAEVEADFRFPREAALRVKLFKHFVDNVVDFVPAGTPGDRFDAPGNIGAGSVLGAELSLRVPLEPMITGGTLNISGLWQDSEVTDPTTGGKRGFSDFRENKLRAEYRQDLNAARFAWGMSIDASSTNEEYRLGEIDRFDDLDLFNVFVETTWIASIKVRLEAQSALAGAEDRDRMIYLPDRNGALAQRITGHYRPGRWWVLSVSSTF